ncbi:MAG: iron-sulfur cluster assembly accessory protein [Acidobacteria bacterium]|nr:MAG: iron-sulfur cluster assembly accessory protein [Acidobacteriota bacterium]
MSTNRTTEGGAGAHRGLPQAGAPLISLTPRALEKIRSFRSGRTEFAGKAFRVGVDGGGCAGFKYTFAFDEVREDDERVEIEEVLVVCDPVSLPYLRGATVDYVEDLLGAGFVVDNPNVTRSCGCGVSFGV